MAQLDTVLSRFNDVKQTGEGKYMARCNCHDDRQQSLGISLAGDGKVLVHCFAGCRTEDILSRAGLVMKNLFPERATPEKAYISATYNYLDANGNLVFQALRYVPKTFKQRRPNGNGGWIWNLKGIETVLYRLPEVLDAVASGNTIFVCEGEKDVDKAFYIGLAATCNPQGAGKWKGRYSDYLRGANVVILPDNDNPGREHAQQVAKSLHGKAASIKILELPGLPEKGDLSDWIALGGTREQLLQLAAAAPLWEPAKQGQGNGKVVGNPYRLSDMGNAERLIEKFGNDLRWNATSKKWLFWDGRRWAEDEKGYIVKCMKETVRSIYQEAAGIEDYNARMMVIDFGRRSESHNKITAAIKLAQSELSVTYKELDRDPWLLNCLNGTINLKTGELHPPRRQDLITKLAPVNYAGMEVTHPTWDKLLNRIVPDPELRSFVQRAVGYSITGSGTEEVLFFAWGEPLTGKTTFLNAISSTIGDYAATADFSTFIDEGKGNGPRNDIARLAGKRFVQSIEVGEGKKLAEGLIKTITGGDTVTARFLYAESFEFLPTFKLWMAANSRPRVREDDTAMWRRILQIPFNQKIPQHERDPKIKEALRDPAIAGSAILGWMVKGSLMWQRDGLAVPDIVKQTTEDYRMEMDPLKDFIEERCFLHPLARVKVADLRGAYEAWAIEYGEKYPINNQRFKRSLEARGLNQYKTKRDRMWQGIGLVDEKRSNTLRDDPSIY